MDRDGSLAGFDLELLAEVTAAVNVPVIASGGAGNPQHMVDAVTKGGASAVLAASIFHYGLCRVAEVKAAMAAAGVPVRPVPSDG
jgi:cyclase